MKLPRRNFLHLAAGAAALPTISRVARAQAYPSRPVRIIVGYSAGSASDIVARLIAQWLSERLGQQFVVENRTGAGGNIAAEAVVRSAPDGYMLYAPPARFAGCNQRHAVPETQFQSHPRYSPGRGGHPRARNRHGLGLGCHVCSSNEDVASGKSCGRRVVPELPFLISRRVTNQAKARIATGELAPAIDLNATVSRLDNCHCARRTKDSGEQ